MITNEKAQLEQLSTEELFNKAFTVGIGNYIGQSTNYKNTIAKIAEIFEENIDFFLSIKNGIPYFYQHALVCELFEDESIKANKKWTEYIEEISIPLSEDSASNVYKAHDLFNVNNNLGELAFKACEYRIEKLGHNPKEIWLNLFDQFLKASQIYGSYQTIPVMEWIAYKAIQQDPDYVISKVKNVRFLDCGTGIRFAIYKELIEEGLLDKKIARRIRSDSSEYLSEKCIRNLFISSNKYSASSFEDLISQFFDTRYASVGHYLANHVPDNLLPFLSGIKHQSVMKVIENRMNMISMKKDSK